MPLVQSHVIAVCAHSLLQSLRQFVKIAHYWCNLCVDNNNNVNNKPVHIQHTHSVSCGWLLLYSFVSYVGSGQKCLRSAHIY